MWASRSSWQAKEEGLVSMAFFVNSTGVVKRRQILHGTRDRNGDCAAAITLDFCRSGYVFRGQSMSPGVNATVITDAPGLFIYMGPDFGCF